MKYLTIFFLIAIICIYPHDAKIYNCNVTSPCGCSSESTANVSQRIVGGEQVRKRTWNWMVSLQYRGYHRCGASLISSKLAVTAAHCVIDILSTMSSLSILVGTNRLSYNSIGQAQRRTVDKIVVHPEYNDYMSDNDIAIIRFSKLDLSESASLSFICLPDSGIDPFVDRDELVAIGWGYTREGAGAVSDVLRQVTVKAISSNDSTCSGIMMVNSTIKFCAGIREGGKDTCQGDSGGPLMAFKNDRWILAGITSSGIGCARPNSAGFYTRVSFFVPFIQSILDQHSTSTMITTTTSKSTVTTSIVASSSAGTTVVTSASSRPSMFTSTTNRLGSTSHVNAINNSSDMMNKN